MPESHALMAAEIARQKILVQAANAEIFRLRESNKGLMDALEDIATLTYGPENLTSVRVLKVARAAIAKAKGQKDA